MLSKQLIVIYLIIGVISKFCVEGLQCYVCEDCNEYEDFKELHICGELPMGTTMKPMTLPENMGTTNPTTVVTGKPPQEDTEEYIYDDSEERHDDNSGSTEIKKEENNNNSGIPAIQKPLTTNAPNIKEPTTLKKEETTVIKIATTYIPETTLIKPISSSASSANVATAPTPASTTASSPKPIQLTDDDDYLDYEESSSDVKRQVKIKSKMSSKSLLKINEPVCYMIKYQANNTVFTNRGCTTFINANKYATCQSLYNGIPMDECRVCSNDGCNKYLSGDSSEDDIGFPVNAGGVLQKFGSFVVLIFAIVFSVLV